MKCPNCNAEISAKILFVKNCTCSSCSASVTTRTQLGVISVLAALPIGKLLYSGYYLEAGIVAAISLAVIFYLTPRNLVAK